MQHNLPFPSLPTYLALLQPSSLLPSPPTFPFTPSYLPAFFLSCKTHLHAYGSFWDWFLVLHTPAFFFLVFLGSALPFPIPPCSPRPPAACPPYPMPATCHRHHHHPHTHAATHWRQVGTGYTHHHHHHLPGLDILGSNSLYLHHTPAPACQDPSTCTAPTLYPTTTCTPTTSPPQDPLLGGQGQVCFVCSGWFVEGTGSYPSRKFTPQFACMGRPLGCMLFARDLFSPRQAGDLSESAHAFAILPGVSGVTGRQAFLPFSRWQVECLL